MLFAYAAGANAGRGVAENLHRSSTNRYALLSAGIEGDENDEQEDKKVDQGGLNKSLHSLSRMQGFEFIT